MVSPIAKCPGLWIPITSPGNASKIDSRSCANRLGGRDRLKGYIGKDG